APRKPGVDLIRGLEPEACVDHDVADDAVARPYEEAGDILDLAARVQIFVGVELKVSRQGEVSRRPPPRRIRGVHRRRARGPQEGGGRTSSRHRQFHRALLSSELSGFAHLVMKRSRSRHRVDGMSLTGKLAGYVPRRRLSSGGGKSRRWTAPWGERLTIAV